MNRLLLSALLVLAGLPAFAQTGDEGKRLNAFFADEWERGLRESPESASAEGDRRYNGRWSDVGLDAIARREAADRSALETLRGFDRARLSPAAQVDYDTYAWQLEHAIARQKYKEHLEPVGHDGGPQTLAGIAEILPFATTRDYRDWLERMAAVPAALEQRMALMREGVKQGRVPPKVLMQRVPAQIAAQVVDDPTRSQFYKPFLKFPNAVPTGERKALQDQARKIVAEKIVPAYRAFGAYFGNEYLPKTRETIAAADMPDGKAYYDFIAGYFTTTDLKAAQIHEIGLKEVARIRAEMEQVKREVGFKGTLEDFFAHLRSDPEFFYETPEALFTAYQAISKRIDPELVKIARTIPRLPYGVRPIPDNIAPDTTTAYYMPGSDGEGGGARPGYYYVNLYKPESRPKWEMMALSLHEAVPGHHFQFARGLELPDAPMFRKTAYFVAYSEGWGLYAERLGYDMGLYDDPYDRMGQLAYDMWRAVRLVVDTGIHSQGWSRDRAIRYFLDNAPKTELDVVNEIDRYIGWPGQALAYKIGQLKISELRARAAKALGAKFDLRDFNDAVLATGSVPLDVLETRIDAWIVDRKRN